jgi:hypothetical protein
VSRYPKYPLAQPRPRKRHGRPSTTINAFLHAIGRDTAVRLRDGDKHAADGGQTSVARKPSTSSVGALAAWQLAMGSRPEVRGARSRLPLGRRTSHEIFTAAIEGGYAEGEADCRPLRRGHTAGDS